MTTGAAGGGSTTTAQGGTGGAGGDGTGGAPPLPEEWLVRFAEAGVSDVDVASIVARSDGSTIVAGTFVGEVDFGTGAIVAENGDMFVLELDPFGQAVWVLTLGDPGDVMLNPRVRTDAAGAVYFAFEAGGPVSFGDGEIPVVDGGDVILAKLDPDGGYEWSARLGSIGTIDNLTAFDVSPDGHVAVGVYYLSSWTVQGETIPAVGMDGYPSSAVLSFDVDGQFLAHRVMPFQSGSGPAILASTIDDDGSMTVAGVYSAATPDPPLPPISVGTRGFVAKLGADGTTEWATGFGEANYVLVSHLAKATQAGDHWLVGEVSNGSIDFGAGPVAAAGVQDLYLARIDPNGQFIKGTVFPGVQGGAAATSLRATAADGVLISGRIGDSMDFGGGYLIGQEGAYTGFGASFDAVGDHLWSTALETNADSMLRQLVEGPEGDLRFAGRFKDTLTFDNTDIAAFDKWGDSFIGRWAPYPPF